MHAQLTRSICRQTLQEKLIGQDDLVAFSDMYLLSFLALCKQIQPITCVLQVIVLLTVQVGLIQIHHHI